MNCPVCDNPAVAAFATGTDFLFETTRQTFSLSSCGLCHSLFLNPLPSEAELATFYPAQYWWNAGKTSFLKRLESIYRNIALSGHVHFIVGAASRRYGAAQPVELLDVGCGSGTLLALLKRSGFRVMGVDFSSEASEVAARENGVQVLVGTLGSVALSAEKFEVVTLFHVMEHLTQPRPVLREVSRILKPGGVIVLQVPNIDSWQFRWFGVRWYGLDVPRHVIDYSRESITRLLSETGFRVQRIKHFNLRDNAPALVSSLFPSLDPVSRSIRQRQRNQVEPAVLSWLKHLVYLALVFCSYPIAMVEAASGHGATIMIEAIKERGNVTT